MIIKDFQVGRGLVVNSTFVLANTLIVANGQTNTVNIGSSGLASNLNVTGSVNVSSSLVVGSLNVGSSVQTSLVQSTNAINIANLILMGS